MTDITIEWLYDERYCETCDSISAQGARVTMDGELLVEMLPIASCCDGKDWGDVEIYKAILNRLGHSVNEIYHD